jgi:hypothetical protein
MTTPTLTLEVEEAGILPGKDPCDDTRMRRHYTGIGTAYYYNNIIYQPR